MIRSVVDAWPVWAFLAAQVAWGVLTFRLFVRPRKLPFAGSSVDADGARDGGR